LINEKSCNVVNWTAGPVGLGMGIILEYYFMKEFVILDICVPSPSSILR
jgi:hypothetical protein